MILNVSRRTKAISAIPLDLVRTRTCFGALIGDHLQRRGMPMARARVLVVWIRLERGEVAPVDRAIRRDVKTPRS